MITSRAPLRLGLAGGGTDVSPFCDAYGGIVVNATIDRYAYATIESADTDETHFVSVDLNISEKIVGPDISPKNTKLPLHQGVFRYFHKRMGITPAQGLKLSTFCDSPIGSGLGSSSTIVVAMLSALHKYYSIDVERHRLAQLAFDIERTDCGFAGGKQDQYSSVFGGLNVMHFGQKGNVQITPIDINPYFVSEIEANSLMYFSGISRYSSSIIESQQAVLDSGRKESVDAMHAIKGEAEAMANCLAKSDFSGIVDSIRNGWRNKKKSAATVSNETIDNIYEAAIKSGALAGKVSGAGGGGFMFFIVPLTSRQRLITTLSQFGGFVQNCHFTSNGVEAWSNLRKFN